MEMLILSLFIGLPAAMLIGLVIAWVRTSRQFQGDEFGPDSN